MTCILLTTANYSGLPSLCRFAELYSAGGSHMYIFSTWIVSTNSLHTNHLGPQRAFFELDAQLRPNHA